MKKISILFCCLFQFSVIMAQDVEPKPLFNQTVTFPNQPSPQFLVGWVWGSHPKFVDETNTNLSQTAWGGDYFKDALFYGNPGVNYTCRNRANAIPGGFLPRISGFIYKPCLVIPNDESFTSIQGDPMHSVFGFKTSIANDGTPNRIQQNSDGNYRLSLFTSDATGYPNGRTVLNNSWPSNNFFRIFHGDSYGDSNKLNGKLFRLTVNLRPSASTPRNNIDVKVIEFKINYTTRIQLPPAPYIYYEETGNIRFYEYLPDKSKISDMNYNSDEIDPITYNVISRGKLMENKKSIVASESFIIYQDMLPNSNQDMTYSATILFDDAFWSQILNMPKDRFNPQLQPYIDNERVITDMKVEVIYHGNSEIFLNYIRLESEYSFEMMQGKHDKKIPQVTDNFNFKDKIGEVLDHFYNSSSNPKRTTSYNFFRINIQAGDDNDAEWNWCSMRYLNKLYDRRLTGSCMGTNYPAHYQHLVEPREMWAAVAKPQGMSAPYYTPDSYQVPTQEILNVCYGFGAWYGLKGLAPQGIWNDPNYFSIKNKTANSQYETWLRDDEYGDPGNGHFRHIYKDWTLQEPENINFFKKLRNEYSNEKYNQVMTYPHGFQLQYEGFLHTTLDKSDNGPKFDIHAKEHLYSDIDWWSETFVGHHFGYRRSDGNADVTLGKLEINRFIRDNSMRNPTGEELSLFLQFPVLLGAKGLLMDREGLYDCAVKMKDGTSIYDSDPDYDNTSANNNLLKPYKPMVCKDPPIITVGLISGSLTRLYNNHQTLFNKTDYEFLSLEELGGDWIYSYGNNPTTPDPSYLDLLMNDGGILSNYLGTHDRKAARSDNPINQMYVGRKTNRIVVRKIVDWIKENETTIMKLKLLSWYDKGFKIWHNWHPYYGNVNIMQNFIKLPHDIYTDESESAIKLRPIGREKDGKPYFESPDSTFYDVTLLAEKGTDIDLNNDQTPDIKDPNKVFYIGVQSRRTDPTILKDDYQTIGDDEVAVDFYTSAEFDARVLNGGNDVKGVYHEASYWKARWWKRLGCREITIPLNVNANNPNDYKLVKVTELASSHTEITDPILKNFLYPKVSTIIGQDGTFTTKYLPGEGKIFKCEVIDQPAAFTGSLAHSNQSKLVACPNSNGDLQYHLVFFKPVLDLDGITRNKVFYRRSLPIPHDNNVNTPLTNLATENIMWESDANGPISRLISNGFTNLDNIPVPLSDCDFPSIVVRPATNEIRASIIYSCAGINYNSKNIIVVTCLDMSKSLNAPDLIIANRHNAIDEYEGLDRVEWGNPVVNASALGNYYAWSTKKSFTQPYTQSAIVYAYALPDNIPVKPLYIGFNKIMASAFSGDIANNVLTEMKHPSVNAYSDMVNAENECSLVWQQNSFSNCTTSLYGETDIYFTRLSVTPPLGYNLPINIGTNNQIQLGGSQQSIGRILNNGNDSYPVVYHSRPEYMLPWPWRTVRYNFIYANSSSVPTPPFFNSTSSIFGLHIVFQNLLNGNQPPVKSFFVDTKTVINSTMQNSLNQPNIAQPSSLASDKLWTSENGSLIKTTGDAVLNYTYNQPNVAPSGNQIYQINPYGHSFFAYSNTFYDYLKTMRWVATGEQSHLASTEGENRGDLMWQNRRVYNHGTAPDILTSARNFYRNFDEYIYQANYVGYGNLSNRMYMSFPKLNDSTLSLKLPFNSVTDTNNQVIFLPNYSDTISSEWFTVDNTALLNFKLSGTGIVCPIVIQRRDSNLIYPVTLPPTLQDTLETFVNYTFINGQGHDYRLIMLKVDSTMGYNEKVMLTDSVPIPGILPTSVKENILDLSHGTYSSQNENGIKLSIYPNPADNSISIKAFVPESVFTDCVITGKHLDLGMKIYNNVGEEIKSCRIKPGEVIKVNTSGYSQGVYFVKAVDDRQTIDCLPIQSVLQGFVIKR